MRKRFIIGIDSTTEEQTEAFYKFAKEQNLGWWHWLANFWLLIDSQGHFSAADIRDKLNETHPGVNNLVLELDEHGGVKWAGFGPTSENQNMFRWLHDYWRRG